MSFVAVLSMGALAACASQAPVAVSPPVEGATAPGMVANDSTLLGTFNTTVIMSPRSVQCLELQRVLEDPATPTFTRQRAREDFNQQECNYRSNV
jgi:hypothetical protein